jgi:plastocyanin
MLAAFVLVDVLLLPATWLSELAHAATTTVTIQDFLFSPPNPTVSVGDTVTWSYPSGSSLHTTTSNTGVWDSGVSTPLSPGQSFSHTFTTAVRFRTSVNSTRS